VGARLHGSRRGGGGERAPGAVGRENASLKGNAGEHRGGGSKKRRERKEQTFGLVEERVLSSSTNQKGKTDVADWGGKKKWGLGLIGGSNHRTASAQQKT